MRYITNEYRENVIKILQALERKRKENTYNVPVYVVISDDWKATKDLYQESPDWLDNIQKIEKFKEHGYNSLVDKEGAIWYYYGFDARPFAANEMYFWHPEHEQLFTLEQLEQEHVNETGLPMEIVKLLVDKDALLVENENRKYEFEIETYAKESEEDNANVTDDADDAESTNNTDDKEDTDDENTDDDSE